MFKINKNYLTFIFLLFACSFHSQSDFWTKHKTLDKQDELKTLGKTTLYSSTGKKKFKEISSTQEISIDAPINNTNWSMPSLNNSNLIKNLKFEGDLNFFFKRKIGKNRKKLLNTYSSPIHFQNNILFSDNNGSIFNLTDEGELIWHSNIYKTKDKKIYKRIHKKISYLFYEGNIYCADNLGNLYSLDSESGEIVWIKNYGKFFNSKIKIINNKIVLVDQDDGFLLINLEDGSLDWSLESQVSLLKSGFLNSVVATGGNSIAYTTSSGNIVNIDTKNKNVLWTISTVRLLKGEREDFLKNSDLVVENEILYYSNIYRSIAINLINGTGIWQKNFGTYIRPVISGKYIFIQNEVGHLLCLDKNTGKTIWSKNLFKNFGKRKLKKMQTTGLIMGSGNLYSTTNNGYIIVVSGRTGEIKKLFKISESFLTDLIISENKLFALTGSSKLLLFK